MSWTRRHLTHARTGGHGLTPSPSGSSASQPASRMTPTRNDPHPEQAGSAVVLWCVAGSGEAGVENCRTATPTQAEGGGLPKSQVPTSPTHSQHPGNLAAPCAQARAGTGAAGSFCSRGRGGSQGRGARAVRPGVARSVTEVRGRMREGAPRISGLCFPATSVVG